MPTTQQAEFVPKTDELLYERRGSIAFLTFNRPEARNALTWAMYEGLYEGCEHVDADDRVTVLVLRGAGDKAFVAGTDISQFRAFSTPARESPETGDRDDPWRLHRWWRCLRAVL